MNNPPDEDSDQILEKRFRELMIKKGVGYTTSIFREVPPLLSDPIVITAEGANAITEEGGNPSTAEGANPITAEGANPSTVGANPSTEEGANPITAEGANPSTEEGANPSTAEGANPSTIEGANPITAEGANPSTEGANPSTEGANPITPEGANPSTEGANPITAEGANPSTEGANPITVEGANPITAEGANFKHLTVEVANPITAEGANINPLTVEVANPITAEGANPVAAEGANPARPPPNVDDRNLGPTSTNPGGLFCVDRHFLHRHISFTTKKGEVGSFNFSPNGELLAYVRSEQAVNFGITRTGAEFYTIRHAHEQYITDVRFGPFSIKPLLATCSLDRTIKLWNAMTFENIRTISGHTSEVISLDFNPEGLTLCSIGRNEIVLWNLEDSFLRRSMPLLALSNEPQGCARLVRFQPPPTSFLAVVVGNNIHILNKDTLRLMFSLKGHTKEVRSISWHPSGKLIASVTEDCVRIWSITDEGMCIHAMSSKRKMASCMFDPTHPKRLFLGQVQNIVLWDPERKLLLANAVHHGIVNALEMSPGEKWVASARSGGNSIKLLHFCKCIDLVI